MVQYLNEPNNKSSVLATKRLATKNCKPTFQRFYKSFSSKTTWWLSRTWGAPGSRRWVQCEMSRFSLCFCLSWGPTNMRVISRFNFKYKKYNGMSISTTICAFSKFVFFMKRCSSWWNFFTPFLFFFFIFPHKVQSGRYPTAKLTDSKKLCGYLRSGAVRHTIDLYIREKPRKNCSKWR